MKNKLGYSKKIIIKLSFFSIFLLAFNSFAITNDEPCNAISLNVNQSCSSSSFTTVGATTSIGIQDPACAGSTYKDVWFKAIVPANGIIQVETQAAGMSDSGMALYTGTCNSLVVRTCDDDGGSGFMSLTWCNNLTPGETVWIRVWRYTGTGTFGICATQQASINCYGNAAAGQDCIGSTPICNINGYCGNTSALYSASSSWPELDNVFTCGGLNNDSFISFVADSTSFVFNVIQTSSLNGDGIQFMVFSAPSCGSASITSYTCEGQISPSLTPTTVTANGLTPGQTYYIVIDGYAGDVCDYTISLPLTGGGVSLPVKINPPTSNICLGQTVQLIAENGNGNYDWISSPDVTSLNVTNNDTVVANPLTVGTFTYVVNSNSGNSSCPNADTDTAIVNVMVGPVTTDGITDTICATGSSTVQGATSNGNPLWTIQAGAGTLTNVNSINPTYNSVTADEGNTVILTMTLVGCGGTSISHDTIRVLPKLFTRVNGNMFYCPSAGSTHLTIPDSLILDSAVWKNNGTVIANAFNTNLSAGSYDIRFWSLNSLCSRDTTITIVSQQDLVLENDQFICQNTYTFSGNIGGGGTGSWAYLNNPNPVPTFSNNTLNATVNFPFTEGSGQEP